MKTLFSLVLSLAAAASAFGQYPRIPLVENFTGLNCCFCRPVDSALVPLIFPYTPVLSVWYHLPYASYASRKEIFYFENPKDNTTRERYYTPGTLPIPSIFVNGRKVLQGLNEQMAKLPKTIDAVKNLTSPFLITVSQDISGKTIKISVLVQSAITATDLTLQTSVVLGYKFIKCPPAPKPTIYGDNAENFYNSMLKMLPQASGVKFSINAGEEKRFDFDYQIGSDTTIWERDQLQSVAFVQDDRTHEILQAGGTQLSTSPSPSLQYPVNKSIKLPNNITVSWDSIEAATYNVQISRVADFSHDIAYQTGLRTPSFKLVGLASNEIYYWRVQSVNCIGVVGEWSDAWSFTTFGSAAEVQENINAGFSFASYPNPMIGGVGTIVLETNAQGTIRISLVSLLGTEPLEIMNQFVDTGKHTIPWNSGAIADGMYFLILETRNKILSLPITIRHSE